MQRVCSPQTEPVRSVPYLVYILHRSRQFRHFISLMKQNVKFLYRYIYLDALEITRKDIRGDNQKSKDFAAFFSSVLIMETVLLPSTVCDELNL